MALPRGHMIGEREGFWARRAEVSVEVPVRGNLLPDAAPAAELRDNGVAAISTHHRDIRKFTFLEMRDAFAPSPRCMVQRRSSPARERPRAESSSQATARSRPAAVRSTGLLAPPLL